MKQLHLSQWHLSQFIVKRRSFFDKSKHLLRASLENGINIGLFNCKVHLLSLVNTVFLSLYFNIHNS